MRLFGTLTGTITRFDRAEWLTPIFDRAFDAPAEAVTVAVTLYVPNPQATLYVPDPDATLESTA